jgi:hypothetical protein
MTTLWPVAFVKAGASRFCTADGAPDVKTWISAAWDAVAISNGASAIRLELAQRASLRKIVVDARRFIVSRFIVLLTRAKAKSRGRTLSLSIKYSTIRTFGNSPTILQALCVQSSHPQRE